NVAHKLRWPNLGHQRAAQHAGSSSDLNLQLSSRRQLHALVLLPRVLETRSSEDQLEFGRLKPLLWEDLLEFCTLDACLILSATLSHKRSRFIVPILRNALLAHFDFLLVLVIPPQKIAYLVVRESNLFEQNHLQDKLQRIYHPVCLRC